MKVVDEDDGDVEQGGVGEIVIRGHNVMKGYWGREDATAEVMRGGWFHSGDMATVDEDGYFFIVDRKKDMIIRGGYNVYPREIEEVLYEHPAVSEVAVIGVRRRLARRGGRARWSCSRTARRRSEDDIRAFVKERVAAYKYPRKIWFSDELPEGPDGQDPQARDQVAGLALSDERHAVGEAEQHGVHALVGGDPLVERGHRARALVLRVDARGRRAACCRARAGRRGAGAGRARRSRPGSRSCRRRRRRSRRAAPPGARSSAAGRRADLDRRAVGHARRLEVARARSPRSRSSTSKQVSRPPSASPRAMQIAP